MGYFTWTAIAYWIEINTQKKYLNKIINQIKVIESERKLCKIKFIGWQSQKNLRHQYEVCDIFILPSYSEGSSIALFEAMSMECFCIAAKVGDVSRIISNKSNGLVFDHTEKNFNNSINYYTKLSSKKNKCN